MNDCLYFYKVKVQSIVKFIFAILICLKSSLSNAQDLSPSFLLNNSDYKIIAFGEASHGSKSDYELRTNLILNAKNIYDSVNIIIEMPHDCGIAIQKYYDGLIQYDSVMKCALYYGLQTDSFKALVDSLKYENCIHFYGVDVQTNQNSLRYLEEQLIMIYPLEKSYIETIVDSLDKDFRFKFNKEEYCAYKEIIDRNLKKLHSLAGNMDQFYKYKFDEIWYPFKIVDNCFKLLQYDKTNQVVKAVKYRDSCMAANVIEITKRTKKTGVLLAANSHVIKSSNNVLMMGGYLKKEYKDKYYVIISQYYSGDVLEVKLENGERSIVTNKIPTPIKNTVPDRIHKLYDDTNNMLIEIDSANTGLLKFLKRKRAIQNFGAFIGNSRGSGYRLVDKQDFDAIYWIPIVKPSININLETQ